MRADFEDLVRTEGRRLYALCFRLTGDPNEAEDLCQEAFTKAFRSYDAFEGRSQTGTWLYRIALNAWKNRLRSKRSGIFRFFAGSKDDDDGKEIEFEGPDRPPEAQLEQAESIRQVQDALQKLDPEDRAVIILRDLDEKTYEEVAELLKLPVGTVKSRLSRARERLRRLVKPLLHPSGGAT